MNSSPLLRPLVGSTNFISINPKNFKTKPGDEAREDSDRRKARDVQTINRDIIFYF
jgi:hypothetical protein